jgi:hypothetical protein
MVATDPPTLDVITLIVAIVAEITHISMQKLQTAIAITWSVRNGQGLQLISRHQRLTVSAHMISTGIRNSPRCIATPK